MAPRHASIFALALGIAVGFGLSFGFDALTAWAATGDTTVVSQQVERRVGSANHVEDVALADVEAARPPVDATIGDGADLDARARAAVSGFNQRVVVAAPEDAARATEAISGTVVDGEGKPIEGVTVVSRGPDIAAVEGRETQDLGRAWIGPLNIDESLERSARSLLAIRGKTRSAMSDADGNFMLRGLVPGKHRLLGFLEGYTFKRVSADTGDIAQIVGGPIGVFRFDVRMPDGSAPESAIVVVPSVRPSGRRGVPRSVLRWTRDLPEVRADSRSLMFTVRWGNVRRLLDRTYASDLASVETTIDLDQDGDGPHVVELTPRSTLRVTLEVPGGDEDAKSGAWVKVVPTLGATGVAPKEMIVRAPETPVGPGGCFEQTGLEAGTYVIAAGWMRDAPEVTETVTIGEGLTEYRIVLGALDDSAYLVVRCIGPDGAPLSHVRFRSTVDNGTFPSRKSVSAIDRGASGYLLPIKKIPGDDAWDESSKVTLTATARNHGQLSVPLSLGQRSVEFVFQPMCSIDVRVEGGEVAGLTVSAATMDDGHGDLPTLFSSLTRGRPVKLNVNGHALLEGFQPGRYRISLLRGGRSALRDPPIATAEVTLTSGTLEFLMSAPLLYDVAVHAPGLDVGKSIYLMDADTSGAAMSFMNGRRTSVDAEHRCLFADVPGGEYILNAVGSGLSQMRITVPCGEVEFVADVIDAMVVSKVKPGKLGERAGLRVGDLAVALDGNAVNGNNFSQKLAVAIEAAEVELTIERGRATVTISLGPIEAGSAAWPQVGVQWSPRTR